MEGAQFFQRLAPSNVVSTTLIRPLRESSHRKSRPIFPKTIGWGSGSPNEPHCIAGADFRDAVFHAALFVLRAGVKEMWLLRLRQ